MIIEINEDKFWISRIILPSKISALSVSHASFYYHFSGSGKGDRA
jgi:hypothetical protein